MPLFRVTTAFILIGVIQIADKTCPLCSNPDCLKFYARGDYPLVNSIMDTKNKYSLYAYRCSNCGLVYINTPKSPGEIFSEYAYFSSWSSSWLEHCRLLSELLIKRFGLKSNSVIVEIASNDGYLLKNFINAGFKNITGIEPANNVAAAAASNGIPTINEFFTLAFAGKLSSRMKADCIIANNVLAHVPDILDFLQGIETLLNETGFAVFEFHHLLNLVKFRQFDTIYHEHFSYLSLFTVSFAMKKSGLRIFDVEKLSTHGGSLRIFASHNTENAATLYPTADSLRDIAREESDYGLFTEDTYTSFSRDVHALIDNAGNFINELKSKSCSIAGYGAAAKAVIFINSLALDRDDIICIADKNPVKQNKSVPGTNIPVVPPSELAKITPDYVIIFPWNLRTEISAELRCILPESTKYIVFMPNLEIF